MEKLALYRSSLSCRCLCSPRIMSRRQSYALSHFSRTATDGSRVHISPYMSTDDPELPAGHGLVLDNHLHVEKMVGSQPPPACCHASHMISTVYRACSRGALGEQSIHPSHHIPSHHHISTLQTNGLNQTSQPREIASTRLLPDKKQQHSFYGQAFTSKWGWEILAGFGGNLPRCSLLSSLRSLVTSLSTN